MRSPISRVRRTTENAVTPYMPAPASVIEMSAMPTSTDTSRIVPRKSSKITCSIVFRANTGCSLSIAATARRTAGAIAAASRSLVRTANDIVRSGESDAGT
jgi:hypothetical protein